MTTRHLLPATLCRRVLVLGALALLPSTISAQAARTGRASLNVPVSFSIPVRLKVASQGPVVLIERTADYIEVELPLTVAANVAWRLRMDAPSASQARNGGITVLTAAGDWEALSGLTVPSITGRREATEPSALKVRLRMPADRSLEDATRLRVSLEPAEGT